MNVRTLSRGLTAVAGLALVGALGYAVYAHFAAPVLPIDDGYIHLRYARNILTGVGPVYNPGVRVMGSSSPLYVAWLVIIGFCARLMGMEIVPAAGAGGNLVAGLPTLAVRLNAVWYVACMVAMAGLMHSMIAGSSQDRTETRRAGAGSDDTSRRFDGSWPLALTLASAATLFTPMLSVSTGAMESYLWGALVLGALWAQAARRPVWAAPLAGLAAVARPEGLILLAFWGLRWLTGLRRSPVQYLRQHWLEIVIAAAPLSIWIVVATWYYGSPLPESVLAKASGLYPLGPEYVPDRLKELFGAWIGGGGMAWNPPSSTPASGGWLWLAHPLTCLLALIGPLAWGRARRAAAWAPAVMLGLLCLFYTIGRTMLLEWYIPLIWVLWYPAVFGGAATSLAEIARAAVRRRSVFRSMALAVVAAVLCLVFGTGPARGAIELLKRPDAAEIVLQDAVRMRTLAYIDVAAWLNENVAPGARLAGTEIGTLGYFYQGFIIDSCALVSPEALKYLPVPMSQRNSAMDGVIGNELVQDLQPEYVTSMPTFASASIMRDRWFLAHYTLVAQFPLPTALWGSSDVLVWARNDLG